MSTHSTMPLAMPARAIGSGVLQRFKIGAKAVVHAIMLSRARKAARTELLMLDDRMLRDIGMSRAEILSVVYGSGADRDRIGR